MSSLQTFFPAAQQQYLSAWTRDSESAPALLIVGAQEDILVKVVKELAQGVVCEAEKDVPCFVCRSCKAVASGTHPDVLTVQTTGKGAMKQWRGVLDSLTRQAMHKNRVVLIEQAERLSLPATHALLKTLEEPPKNTRFLLTTRLPRALPLTVRSRCHRLVLASQAEKNGAQSALRELIEKLEQQKEELSPEMLEQIARSLQETLRTSGPSPTLRRAFMRLRDYYKIKQAHGNEKLAREILVASLL